MRLSDFIRANMEPIINEWEIFARTLPAIQDMNRATLRDHAKEILEFIARDIDAPQTALGQSEKSKGHGPEEGGSKDSAAQTHADLRSVHGFDIVQLTAEYRALRASVIKLWMQQWTKVELPDLLDLIRFNESIDQALMESVVRFKEKIAYSKDMFIGILSHDLRTPLNAILMSSQILSDEEGLSEDQDFLISQIDMSVERMNKMITDLLDLTRINLGTGIPIRPCTINIGATSTHAIEEIQAAYPDLRIVFNTTGNLDGIWDNARIGQVFSNLIGNARQHGLKNSPINVRVTGKTDKIIISVHNAGRPIPPSKLEKIFDSLTSVTENRDTHQESTSLGLGLYITKEIVIAHGGKIDVTSLEKEGTTFTVHLPRYNT